ncbi:hypothetical protein OH76DRAFT_1433680 [Lentinus brumalis]|uniref:Uncharacterized protein n=1 Tax=Lentinus brumalis TaxID=2498619 RepID=A0A371DK19_9APHY|nr:hypothetical protein OH76DRAFT_1433680 [Polyporus brumalis]
MAHSNQIHNFPVDSSLAFAFGPAPDPDPENDSSPTWKPTLTSFLHTAPTASASELLSALEDRPTHLSSRYTRTSPPPHYNPYPYGRTWRLERPVLGEEQYLWYHREDEWMKLSTGGWNSDLRKRIFNKYVTGIRDKQHAARKEWEEQQLREKSPPIPLRATPPRELEHLPIDPDSLVDHRFDLEFMTANQEKGFPVKTLLSGRRAIEKNMHSPKGVVFDNYYQDNIWVRIKWPAYPDHEPARSVLVTFRCAGKSRRRRPCNRLEFSVALAAVITRYYDEVSAMEPHPAFEHLALGPGEGRISLYALRMMGLRAAENGIFDLLLELDTSDADAQSSSVDEVKIIEPSWPSVLPVTCTLAPPPKIPQSNYFAHLDPDRTHAMPAWSER